VIGESNQSGAWIEEILSQRQWNRRDTVGWWRGGLVALEVLQVMKCNNSASRVHTDLHIRNLFVNIFHELDDEINQFRFVEFLEIEIRNEKREIIAL
jgi:NAD-specific glutamate dehydrogenase